MKIPFQAPEMEVICFDVEDVITTSFGLPGMTEEGDGGAEGGGSTQW